MCPDSEMDLFSDKIANIKFSEKHVSVVSTNIFEAEKNSHEYPWKSK